MTAREIKELSFALEALSRIPDASFEYDRVKSLLNNRINALDLETFQPVPAPQAPDPDDDIPF